jgi:hypothetical protein
VAARIVKASETSESPEFQPRTDAQQDLSLEAAVVRFCLLLAGILTRPSLAAILRTYKLQRRTIGPLPELSDALGECLVMWRVLEMQ